MNQKILILIVSAVLVVSAGMAAYSYASAGSNSSTALKTTSGPEKWTLITPVYNSTMGMYVANVSGWGEISVFIGSGGGLYFANSLNGLYQLHNDVGTTSGGCVGTGNNVPFYQEGECGLNTNPAGVLTTMVQGELVGIGTSSTTVSIYATVGSVIGG